jgi:hypothetical protein
MAIDQRRVQIATPRVRRSNLLFVNIPEQDIGHMETILVGTVKLLLLQFSLSIV